MELVWDIYYVVLRDGSLIVNQYTRNDSLERRQIRLTKHCFSYCAFRSYSQLAFSIFIKSDHSVRCVYFLFFLWSGLFCFVLVPVR